MTDNVQTKRHLTTPQRRALGALADGATRNQAALIANRTRRTLDRWIADDNQFGDALKASTDAAVTDAGRRLAGLLELAITELGKLLSADDVPPHVRLRAIDGAVANLVRLREFDELEKRIAALEERIS